MPIQAAVYTPFSEISINLDHSYSPQMQKSAACDRLLNLIYDETFTRISIASRTQRIEALTKYHSVKRSMEQAWYPFGEADNRGLIRDYTYVNALNEFNETSTGRAGRYHRALMSVINETAGHSDKQGDTQIWLNNTITAIRQDFNLLLPPFVAEITVYRINAGTSFVNDGSDINLSEGDRIDMYTTGINFGGSQWQFNGSDIGGAVEESYRISSVVIADTGAYTNDYTNQSGTTTSDEFNLVVT